MLKHIAIGLHFKDCLLFDEASKKACLQIVKARELILDEQLTWELKLMVMNVPSASDQLHNKEMGNASRLTIGQNKFQPDGMPH